MKSSFTYIMQALAFFSAVSITHASSDLTDSLCLGGEWEIVFDAANTGKAASWYLDKNFDKQDIRKITVPSCWEEIEEDYEGVAFYRKKFDMPAAWNGRTVTVEFDAVNYVAELWVNEQVVGYHEGGFSSFSFNITDLVKPGEENTLTLRVVGPIILTDQRIDGMGRMEVPQWRGAITGGIWQPVKLTAAGDVLIKDVFIESDLDENSAKFTVGLDCTESGNQATELHARVTAPNGETVAEETREVHLQPGKNKEEIKVTIEDARYWSPDDPYLYVLEMTVSVNGIISDRYTQKYGMREFTIRDKKFVLNGKSLYIKATFFEGLYPVKMGYPDSEKIARQEIQLAKDAGFNMIRPWRKPPPKMWLDLCDEMGMMTIGSLAIECMSRPLSSPQLPYRVENELRQAIARDINRTCVVQWELFNELHRPILKQMLRPMALLARELDPSRLILDESGGFAHGASMYLPYEKDPTKFNDIHYYPGSQINEIVYNSFIAMGLTAEEKAALGMNDMKFSGGAEVVPGLMSVVSELGYGSLPNLPDNIEKFKQANPLVPALDYHQRIADETMAALKLTGLDSVYSDLEKFCLEQQKMHGIANKRMIEATRSNPKVNGYCIHALTGGDWVIGAGLLDLWRQPKTDVYHKTAEANQERITAIRVSPRNLYAGESAKLQVIGINELDSVDVNVQIELKADSGEVAYSGNFQTSLASGVSDLLVDSIKTNNLYGSYSVNVTIRDLKGSEITSNNTKFDVFTKEQLKTPVTTVAVLGGSKKAEEALMKAGIIVVNFHDKLGTAIPVVVGWIPQQDKSLKNEVDILKNWVKKGGNAVFLNIPGNRVPMLMRKLQPNPVDGLPYSAKMMEAKGLWINKPHIVTDHPVFKGLPSKLIMHGLYENVHPTYTMMMQEGEYISGVVAYDWYMHKDKMLRHYNGPGAVWWGADVLSIEQGKGTMLLSTLRILENLGKDPVADRILFNMVEFLDSMNKELLQ
jgi:hypothetical protein